MDPSIKICGRLAIAHPQRTRSQSLAIQRRHERRTPAVLRPDERDVLGELVGRAPANVQVPHQRERVGDLRVALGARLRQVPLDLGPIEAGRVDRPRILARLRQRLPGRPGAPRPNTVSPARASSSCSSTAESVRAPCCAPMSGTTNAAHHRSSVDQPRRHDGHGVRRCCAPLHVTGDVADLYILSLV